MILYFIVIDNRIEKFDIKTTIVSMPNITDDNKVSILAQDRNSLINSNDSITTNARETLEIQNLYSETITLTSSYIPNQPISSLFKLSPPAGGIILVSPDLYKDGKKNIKNGFPNPVDFYNYICINLVSTNINAKSIELSYNRYELYSDNDFINKNDKPPLNISIYTGDNNNYNHLGTKTNITNGNTSLIFDIDAANKLIKSNIYIFISTQIRSITLTKLRFNIEERSVVQNTKIDENIIRFSSGNSNEQISVPAIYTTQDIEAPKSSTPLSNYQILNNIFKFYTPWAIYDGKRYNSSRGVIPELLNRECKNAIVSGKNANIAQEGKISYLSGTTETIVDFPEYSLPEYYTICAITKYTNSDPNKNYRILTTQNESPNWLLGHHSGFIGVMHNRVWRTHPYENVSNNINDWVVSCVKSSATSSVDNTMLFNGIKKSYPNQVAGKIDYYNSGDKSIVINKCIWGQKSDFGLSYLIIWDKVLSDNQLKTVSDSLLEYLRTGSDLDLSGINVNLNDGSTREKAAVSAMAIKELTCTNKNGLYWILPKDGNPANAKQIYCIMDSNFPNGGGWMLALKGAKNSNAFVYFSSHWTTNSVLNENNQDHEAYTDAKYDIYNYYEAKECLAMFDGNDTNGELTNFYKPEYGYIWYLSIMEGKNKISLLDFNKPKDNYPYGTSYFIYTSQNTDKKGVENWMNSYRLYGGNYINYSDFENYLTNATWNRRLPLNTKIFSHQNGFKAYGFNVKPTNYMNHLVRWGAIYNNEQLPDTCDVSGGIGLNTSYSAGDYLGCCESVRGINASMGFKWFIR